MRKIALFAIVLVAGCTPDVQRPQPPAPPQAPRAIPVAPPQRGDLAGLTAAELVQRFGNPALQIREGQSLKLQFRGTACIIDAYLYPTQSGARVTHVDARRHSGAEMDQRACIAAFRGS